MRDGYRAIALALICAAASVSTVSANTDGLRVAQAARTCKQVDSCEEAVELWCGGYRRADADKDGIPCENVCHSKDQVDDIRADIGC